MPKMENHQAQDRVQILLAADSSSGKTSSLATLANAGYKLRILDFDNGLDVLRSHLSDDGLANVHFKTLRDDIEAAKPTAWKEFRKVLKDGWTETDENGEVVEELGRPRDWGTDMVLAIDSATFMTSALKHEILALNQDKMTSQLSQPQWGDVSRHMTNLLESLTSHRYGCNMIITATTIAVEDANGVSKMYPNIGSKPFAQSVSSFFNNVIGIKSMAKGRKLRTVSDGRQEYKNTNPRHVPAEMDPDLAELFALLKK
jgi:hypothetical protein